MRPVGLDLNVNFCACLILFLASRPKLRELLVASIISEGLDVSLGLHGNLAHRALEVLSYCGAASIPTVALMPLFHGRPNLKLLGKLLFLPCFGLLSSLFLHLGSRGLTYDRYLYAFDGSLGFQPSFLAGQILTAIPWIGQFTRALYDGLPLFLVTAYLIEERRSSAHARGVLLFMALIGICGAACFFVFPAVGTYLMFPKVFPLHPPALSAIPLAPAIVGSGEPRNCMPSLHTAWALVVLWAAGRCSLPWRILLRVLLSIMLLQTLMFHYLVDMVVAVPFTLSLYALTAACPWSPGRLKAIGFGLATVAGWMIALRWGVRIFQISAIVPWCGCLLTIAASWWLWRQVEAPEAVSDAIAPSGSSRRPLPAPLPEAYL